MAAFPSHAFAFFSESSLGDRAPRIATCVPPSRCREYPGACWSPDRQLPGICPAVRVRRRTIPLGRRP